MWHRQDSRSLSLYEYIAYEVRMRLEGLSNTGDKFKHICTHSHKGIQETLTALQGIVSCILDESFLHAQLYTFHISGEMSKER